MFILLLTFSANKSQAAAHMQSHKDWIKRGLDEGVFLVVGSLQPATSAGEHKGKGGGAIIAHNTTRAELQARVNDDPFVRENVVSAEIIEVSPQQTDERLKFLLA